MATTNDNVGYVKLDEIRIWADSDGKIHFTTDDSDPEIRSGFHVIINNNPRSELYHSRAYRTAAQILTRYGKTVPGWDGETAQE